MQTKSLFKYYFFGTVVRYLQDARPGYIVHDAKDSSSTYTLGNIEYFFEYLDELDLQVTARASQGLRRIRDELEPEETDAILSAAQAERISQAATEIRMTLEAELKGFVAYTVTPKRIDTTKLTADVAFLLSPGVYQKLPEIARYDLAEAGKCIAFERSTSAAFHLMRAVESVLRAFLACHIPGSTETLWGPMTIALRAILDDPEHVTLLNNLDNIRLSFRNPTQHPDKIYDIEEAQDLWSLSVDVINRMARDLPTPSSARLPAVRGVRRVK